MAQLERLKDVGVRVKVTFMATFSIYVCISIFSGPVKILCLHPSRQSVKLNSNSGASSFLLLAHRRQLLSICDGIFSGKRNYSLIDDRIVHVNAAYLLSAAIAAAKMVPFENTSSLPPMYVCVFIMASEFLSSEIMIFFHSETFSFMLTGEDGSRRFGYCRRLLVSHH